MSFRETVDAKGQQDCLAKSANKHNRIYSGAEPITEELVQAIEDGKLNPRDDVKIRGKYLADNHGWDAGDARKIWAFGPDGSGPNIIVDDTKVRSSSLSMFPLFS